MTTLSKEYMEKLIAHVGLDGIKSGDNIARFELLIEAARADLVAENERLKSENTMREDGLRSAIRLRMELEDTRTALAAAEADNRQLQRALVDSISWHDDSGRYLPAFNCIEEASSIYGFSDKSDMSALREMIAGAIDEFVFKFKRHVGGDGEFWLHELEDYADSIRALAEKAKGE